MMLILIQHILIWGENFVYVGSSSFQIPPNYYYKLFLLSFSSFAVGCFMLMSGFFGIKFKYSTLLNFIFQAFVYALLGYCVQVNCCNGKFFDFKSILVVLFPISSSNRWFLTGYVFIMILSPLINKGLEFLSKRNFFILLAIMYYYTCIGPEFYGSFYNGSGYLMFLYLLGRYLNQYNIIEKINKSKSILLFVSGNLFCFLLILFAHVVGKSQLSFFRICAYGNPWVICMAIGIFSYVLKLRPLKKESVNTILKHTFAIYLITESLGKILYEKLVHILNSNILLFFVLIVIIGFTCMVIDYLLLRLYSPLRNAIIIKLRLNESKI